MKLYAFFAATALLSTDALAWDCKVWTSNVPGMECYKPPQPQSTNAQHQGQRQSQSQASKSTSTATAASTSAAGADNAGNQQSTAYNSNTHVEDVRQTPIALAGIVQPTSSCRNAINGGASSPVAALSFGVGTRDDECDLRETARELYAMGQPALAIELLCKSKAAKRLKTCEAAPIAQAAPIERTYTREEVDAIVRKVVSK